MTDHDFIPGTVHLVDLEGTLNTKHASGRNSDVVLVPAPSDDSEDPLNWVPRRKLLATSCICVYTFAIGIASASIYSVLVPISEATGLTLGDLNAGTGYMFLLFGWGCLFWQPLAIQYGKRPVYLISTLATMAILIWVPYTNTNGQWIGSKLLQGFFGAPIESLCEISFTDTYFAHERGSYIAIYAFFLAGSSFLAPVLAGFINDGQGWQWVLYWSAILCAVASVFLFLFMEETNYRRTMPRAAVISTGTGTSTSTSPIGSKSEIASKEVELANVGKIVEAGGFVRGGSAQHFPPKMWFAKLKLFDSRTLQYPNRLQGMVTRPLIFLSFPVIAYAGFCYGANLVWFNVLNGTASAILSAPPYNFASSSVGLAYLSPLIGITLGSLYTGRAGDWLVLKLTRSRGGIFESEYRLWLFGLSGLFVPFGLILWGVGAAHDVQWFGLIFAMGVIGFTNSLGIQISISYCIESYRELGSEALVTVILIRNTMSFAIGYGITPWITNMGLQNAFIVAAFAGLAQVLTFLIFVKYGRALRKASVSRYHYYVEEMATAGIVT